MAVMAGCDHLWRAMAGYGEVKWAVHSLSFGVGKV